MGTPEGIQIQTDADVIGINRRSVFSLAEARSLFPVVFRLTKQCAEKVEVLIGKIEQKSHAKNRDHEEIEIYESQASQLIQDWQTKIQKLGGIPQGHWIVDFDSGDGYFCWKYPEPALEYWHHYRDGFTKRKRLPETIEKVGDGVIGPVSTEPKLNEAVQPT